MTDADFEKAKSPKDKNIQILHFAELSSIRPIFYDKTYHAVPESGANKAYELLRRAMLEEKKFSIAKSVIGQSEKLICLIPTEHGILAETLFFIDEVKTMPKEPGHPELSEAELTMAKTLVNSMAQDFQPELYHDEYQVRLREIIEAKISGQEITQTPSEQQTNVINIMDALEASLKQMTLQHKTPPKKRESKKKISKADHAS